MLAQLDDYASFTDLLACVKAFKDLGNTREDTLEALNQLRQKTGSEDKEYTVLDLMDLVSGYCSPDKDIWL